MKRRTTTSSNEAADQALLPPGRYFLATWGIPQDFGGLTTVLLKRARAIASVGGRQADVLTFSATFDLAGERDRLTERGILSHGVRLRNLWEELAELSDAALRRFLGKERIQDTFEAFLPLHRSDVSERSTPGQPVAWAARSTKGGKKLQVDYFRADGSLLLTDRHDATMRGRSRGRVMTVCDSEGFPLASFARPNDLFALWLDAVTAGRDSFVIVDSAHLSRYVHDYRRPHVVTAQVWHSAHLYTVPPPGPRDRLVLAKWRVMPLMHDFDAHITLTQAQSDDLDVLLGPSGRRFVIPNSSPTHSGPAVQREGGRGVVIARLDQQKQIDQSIRAVAAYNSHHGARLTLDIFGSGPDEERLRAVIEEVGDPRIALRGYTTDAPGEYARADFTLQTGETEGFPLSIIESMAAGCVPIAYDVRYGPADMIEDRSSGYLVPAGDVDALVEALEEFSALPDARVDGMRAAARRRARDFSEESVLARWGDVLRTVQGRRGDEVPLRAEATSVSSDPEGGLTVTGTAARAFDAPAAALTILGRNTTAFVRLPGALEGGTSWRFHTSTTDDDLLWLPAGTYDVGLEITERGTNTRIPLPAGAPAGTTNPFTTDHGRLVYVAPGGTS